MQTIIESLFVLIGMDRTEYQKGMADQARDEQALKDRALKNSKDTEEADKKARGDQQRRQREIIEHNKKVADSFDTVKRQAIGMFAVLTGANTLKDFIGSTVTGLSDMSRAAQAAGLHVQDLSAFGNLVERNGGNNQGAQASLVRLASVMENWRTLGQLDPTMALAFSRIGAQASDNPIAVYERFADWAGRQKDKQLVAQEGGMLGFDEAAVNMAMQGGGAVRAGLAESRHLVAVSDADAAKVKALQEEWKTLGQTIKGDATEMLVDAAPALTNLIHLIDAAAQKTPGLTKAILALGTGLTLLGSARTGIGILRTLLGGGAAAGGVEVAGGTAAAATAPAWIAPAAIAGALVYAIHPSGGETGEDARMAARWAAWRKMHNVTPTTTVADRQKIAQAFFIAHGWDPAHAAGMAAAMTAENGQLSTTARPVDKNGHLLSTAVGLGQLLATRQADFKAWSHGGDYASATFEQQLEFMNYELTQGKERKAGAAIRGQPSALGAMLMYLKRYMRPGAGLAGDIARGERALSQIFHVDKIIVQTQAKDATGVARGIRGALAPGNLVTGSASGVPG